jgi:glycosyltransferase involved in cell wall biosynthesis
MTSVMTPVPGAPAASSRSVLVAESGVDGAAPAELTIAIPTFRRPALLLQAVESVARQHRLDGVELLIVDNDAQADDAFFAELQRRAGPVPLRYFRNEENVGMFGNWNRCIALCRTDWMTILNDDDLLLPDYVEEMTQLRQRVDSVAYACRCQVLDERPVEKQGNRRFNIVNRLRALQSGTPLRYYGSVDYFLQNRHYGSLGILFSRRMASERNGFAAEYYPSADYEFFSGLTARGRITQLDKPLAVYRISVNESLKLETIDGWRRIDAVIRRRLGDRVAAPEWLRERYIRLAAAYEYAARLRESKIVLDVADAPCGRLQQLGGALSLRLTGWALRARHRWSATRHPGAYGER